MGGTTPPKDIGVVTGRGMWMDVETAIGLKKNINEYGHMDEHGDKHKKRDRNGNRDGYCDKIGTGKGI